MISSYLKTFCNLVILDYHTNMQNRIKIMGPNTMPASDFIYMLYD